MYYIGLYDQGYKVSIQYYNIIISQKHISKSQNSMYGFTELYNSWWCNKKNVSTSTTT